MAFVGRARALSRLLAAVEESSRGRARLVLVSGEAGIGKTMLVTEAATLSGLSVGWGTCVDADRAPAFWPWTAALRRLLSELTGPDVDAVTHTDTAELARLLPELLVPSSGGLGAGQDDGPPDTDAARLRLFDAVARLLERLARRSPTLIVLDDLQWADESTLALLRFVVQPYRPVPMVIVGCYRHDELGPAAMSGIGELAVHGEQIQLHGLSVDEIAELVADTVGGCASRECAEEVHRRTNGHPFFARQLAEAQTDSSHPSAAVPLGARDLVMRRVQRLSPNAVAFVEAAAVAGNDLLPDVLGEVCGIGPSEVATCLDEGVHSGVLIGDGTSAGSGARLVHDLFRETICAELTIPRRLTLHQRIADALEHRRARGGTVVAADLARHCAEAVPLDGADRAIRWAREAASIDRTRLAFAEAGAHLARARDALEASGDPSSGSLLVTLLVEEADARARAGAPGAARTLLEDARQRAVALDDAGLLGKVALGTQRLGARFAMPRESVVELLEGARRALHGTGTQMEAQLTASLARELHHSVPTHRARARPLSEYAIELARRLGDPDTLAACLLARHDVLWTPGRATERVGIAREIAELAELSGNAERRAEGLLLTANALLEAGATQFRAPLAEYLHTVERFGQPRYDYLAITRRGALALLDGRLEDAEQLIAEAARLGERIGEPDTGNVRMSQLVGLVRARCEPAELRATAAEAVRWWVGIPSHAHAVAAGFLALAGEPNDLSAARTALDTVMAIDSWRADRSYLWSVFVGAMATAAVRLHDRAVCVDLLTELEPVTDHCGVNGALVCFMGSNAHWAGILAAALGHTDDARRWLQHALAVHQRLGASAWETESHLELAALGVPGHAHLADRLASELGLSGVTGRLQHLTSSLVPGYTAAELRRDGQLWCVRHHNIEVHLPDLKGLADLAALLARPGADVHVLELVGAGNHGGDSGTLIDPTARAAYRRRLAELDEDLSEAHADNDIGRTELLDTQRAALLAELRRAVALGGRSRPLGSSTSERARKAVTARARDAIRRIAEVLPELGEHLDRSITTGTTCRYEPTEPLTWTVTSRRTATGP
ncbi:MAG: ATPase-like protein [Pseudonocardia sp.]|nr:ATPase-like protein [Pseudonocardia sp.]